MEMWKYIFQKEKPCSIQKKVPQTDKVSVPTFPTALFINFYKGYVQQE